ncbi:outer membrane lipoprotein carrier protein LolA [soil metagenome]
MASFSKKWIPAIAVPVLVIAGGAIITPIAANAAVDLPDKTPTQVLALLAGTKTDAFSGTITQTSDLGLPSLSSAGATSSFGTSSSDTSSDDALVSTLALLTGTHTIRAYVDGPSKTRVQLMDQLAEKDVVRNGSNVWVYDSTKKSVQHAKIAAHDSTPDASTATPNEVATKLVTALEPSSALSVGTDLRVAGRTAYTLVLTPKAADTLVGEVSVSVDSATGLPLSVAITARGESSPAFTTAFTSVTLGAPSANLFDFTAPKGATVTQLAEPSRPAKNGAKSGAAPTVSGTGWDAIVSVPALGDAVTSTPQLAQLTTAVDGGRLLHTALVNVLITDDGSVYAGSVSPAKLESAASAK